MLWASTKEAVANFRAHLKAAVSDAVDAKVRAEGGVNQYVLQNLRDGLKEQLFERLENLAVQSSNAAPAPEERALRGLLSSSTRAALGLHIQESFQFTSGITRLNGWRQ